MAVQVIWDKYETALLIDACIQVEQGLITRTEAVRSLSKMLRQRARDNGLVIDSIFRNENGISMQLSNIKRLLHNVPNASQHQTRLFIEMVDLYRSDKAEFVRILTQAKGGNQKVKTNQELFWKWLSERVSPSVLSDYYLVVPAIESFAKKKRIYSGSIFDVLDSSRTEMLVASLRSDRTIQFSNSKQILLMLDVTRYYHSYTLEKEAEYVDNGEDEDEYIEEEYLDEYSEEDSPYASEDMPQSNGESKTLQKAISEDDFSQTLANRFNVQPETYSGIKIEELTLSVRSYNCLTRASIDTIEKLLSQSIEQLYNIRNMGAKSVEEILQRLSEFIIDFAEGKIPVRDKLSEHAQLTFPVTDDYRAAVEALLLDDEFTTDGFSEEQCEYLSRLKTAVETVGADLCLEAFLNPESILSIRSALIEFANPYIVYTSMCERAQNRINNLPESMCSRKLLPFLMAYSNDYLKLKSYLFTKLDHSTTIKQIPYYLEGSESLAEIKLKAAAIDAFTEWLHFDLAALVERFFTRVFDLRAEKALEVFSRRANGETLETVGKKLGITRERVRQLEKKVYERFCDLYKTQKYNFVLLISALCDGATLLHFSDIENLIGDEYAQSFWTCIQHIQDNPRFYFSKPLNAIVIREDDKPVIEGDIERSVFEIVDKLPQAVECVRKDDLLKDLAQKESIPVGALEVAFFQKYQLYGRFYFRGRLTVVYKCEFVLKAHFHDGFKISDHNEAERFRKYMRDLFGESEGDITDRALDAKIGDIGVLCDRGKYIHPDYLQVEQSIMDAVYAYIETSTHVVMPYGEIFNALRDTFAGSQITNRYILQGALKKYGCKYNTRRDYVSKNQFSNLTDELERFIEDHGVVHKSEIFAEFTSISEASLGQVVARCAYVFNIDNGYYIHASQFDIQPQDYVALREYLTQKCTGIPVNIRAVYDDVTAMFPQFIKRSNIKDKYYLFAALNFMFGGEFSFSRPYIAKLGETDISNKTVLLAHIEGRDSVEIEELIDLCIENKIHYVGTSYLCQMLAPEYLRVNESTLMLRELTGVTDEVISSVTAILEDMLRSQCYIVASKIQDFSRFPQIDVDWDPFLLESILQYSNTINMAFLVGDPLKHPNTVFVSDQYKGDTFYSLLLKLLTPKVREGFFASKTQMRDWLYEEGFIDGKLPSILESAEYFYVNATGVHCSGESASSEDIADDDAITDVAKSNCSKQHSTDRIGNDEAEGTVSREDGGTMYTVDFASDTTYEFTKPVSASYFGTDITETTWRPLFVHFCKCLYADYPQVFAALKRDATSGNRAYMVFNADMADRLTKPVALSEDVCVETCRSATDLIRGLKHLLDACNVSYENVTIHYVKRNSHTSTPADVFPKIEEDQVISYLQQSGIPYVDLRSRLGCLWIIGGLEIKEKLKPINLAGVPLIFSASGGKMTNGKPAWWTKADTSSVQIQVIENESVSGDSQSEPAEPSPEAKQVSLDQKSFSRDAFMQWMKRWEYSSHTCASYASAIAIVGGFAKDRGLIDRPFYDSGDAESIEQAWTRLQTYDDFRRINQEQHHRFSAAMRVFLAYLKDEKPQAATSSIPVQRTVAAPERTYSATHPGRREFEQWLSETQCPSGTIKIYAESVDAIGKYLLKHDLEDRYIYAIRGVARLERIRERLKTDSEFLRHTSSGGLSRDLYALKKYIAFRKGGGADDIDEELSGRYAAVLKTYFENGFRPKSLIDRNRFKMYYAELHGEEPKEDSEEILRIIQQIGVLQDERIHVREEAASNDLLDDMLAEMAAAFKQGASCIYYSELFARYQDTLASQMQVYSEDVMKTLLIEASYGAYRTTKDYFYSGLAMSDVKDDISTALRHSSVPMTYDEMHQILWYIPIATIKRCLTTTPGFVNVAPETYFYAHNLPISTSELAQIAEVMHAHLMQHSYLTDMEMRALIEKECPSAAINTSDFSTYGLRDCLKYLLSDQFSFVGSIISPKGQSLSMSQVFASFCASHESITLDEIRAFAKENNDGYIYWDSIMEVMVRINQNTFVPKRTMQFDVAETDRVLHSIMENDYIPLRDFNLFLHFPTIGVPWNTFVLESYVAGFSKEYRLLHLGFAVSECCGAVVRRDSGIQDFDALLTDVLAHSDAWKTTADALSLLVKEGYLQRSRYNKIDEIVLTAKLRREALQAETEG